MFTNFDDAQNWYERNQLIKNLLIEKASEVYLNGKGTKRVDNRVDSNTLMVSLNDAAAILTSYLTGPTQK